MQYYFLVASLPHLEIGGAAPLTTAALDEMLAETLPESRLRAIQAYAGGGAFPATCRVYREMAVFETYLRTRIAQKRAERAGISFSPPDPEVYFGEVDYGLSQASSCANPLEREFLVDRLRWARLDELALGHDFDFDALCIYRTKLVIINKYNDFQKEAGTVNFSAALERISGAADKAAKESLTLS
ncbi:MAG: DUF2764 family protein [Lentisphaeria bacterium]|nr:DUF2764 family protein [Lentisphaeria bacterium]